MRSVTIPQIDQRLEELPDEKLELVYDFVSYLVEREAGRQLALASSGSFMTMLASEDVLRRDWESPEEDEAWADL
jgi:hypothetical protein